MTIDADGAPNAYNAENTGLDDLANAGDSTHWDGLVANREGVPLIQGPDDPFPGYYVSCTALTDRTKSQTDPARYVDASKIPYIVLPGNLARDAGARLGDFAVVTNTRNGKSSYAIFADIGTLGEGSIALADNLGIWSNAREGGTRGGIIFQVFPGSGNGQPRTVEEINTETAKLVQDAGEAGPSNGCAAKLKLRTPRASLRGSTPSSRNTFSPLATNTPKQNCNVSQSDRRRSTSKRENSERRFPRGVCSIRGRARGWCAAQRYCKRVEPIRYWSTAAAALRPSAMAQTTSDWPRRMSPAAKTPRTEVM